MPTLRPDSIFQEWLFSPEEEVNSKILPHLLILRLNTMYAELVKELAAVLPPSQAELDRAYLLERAEKAGQLALITQLFQEHKEAMDFLNSKSDITKAPVSQNSELHNLETRAASHVHGSSNSL